MYSFTCGSPSSSYDCCSTSYTMPLFWDRPNWGVLSESACIGPITCGGHGNLQQCSMPKVDLDTTPATHYQHSCYKIEGRISVCNSIGRATVCHQPWSMNMYIVNPKLVVSGCVAPTDNNRDQTTHIRCACCVFGSGRETPTL